MGPGWIWGILGEQKQMAEGRKGAEPICPSPCWEMVTFAGDPVPAEAVARAAGAEEAAGGVVAGVVAGTAPTPPPALVHVCGDRGTAQRQGRREPCH